MYSGFRRDHATRVQSPLSKGPIKTPLKYGRRRRRRWGVVFQLIRNRFACLVLYMFCGTLHVLKALTCPRGGGRGGGVGH